MGGYADTATSATCVQIDPALERQLALASGNQLIEAVLLLRSWGGTGSEVEAEAMLARVSRMEPGGALTANYLPRLGALVVRARPSMVRRLIAQPEVELASANRAVSLGSQR